MTLSILTDNVQGRAHSITTPIFAQYEMMNLKMLRDYVSLKRFNLVDLCQTIANVGCYMRQIVTRSYNWGIITTLGFSWVGKANL